MALTSAVFKQTPMFIDRVRQCVDADNGHVTGRFASFGLDSAYQSIFSLAHKRVVG